MALHIPTLLVVSVFIFFLMSLLTFHAWLRETRERPLAYLGGMMLLAAVGVVLVAFSQVLAETLGTKDVFARIGGEEFACLLAATDEQAAVTVAERVRQAFARLPLLEPGLLSVSIGVVSSETRGYDLPRLLSLADEALYGAKHQGRNRVHTVSRSALELQPD
ncbi:MULTISPECIES: GGDEF domain-containing protein [unclassified Pseudomonas]|uniref:GGDEF domain-containing protein n=1 Tax=unclassified Pseudomonas TaxID=196821 RepID=UPI0016032658|nr:MULTISPECIES: GGDEF domain-containing protein [unclassified Pseudomonas]